MGNIGKPSIKNFGKPRPRALMLLGKSLDRIGKAIAIGTVMAGYQYAPIIAIILGEIGNGLTEFYAAPEINSNNSNNQNQETK